MFWDHAFLESSWGKTNRNLVSMKEKGKWFYVGKP